EGPPPTPPDEAMVDLGGGNTALIFAVDPGSRAFGDFIEPFAFINVKGPDHNGLPNSPIAFLSTERGTISFTASTFPPQKLMQPRHFKCSDVENAEGLVGRVQNDLNRLRIAEAKAMRSEARRAGAARTRFKTAVSTLSDLFKMT